MPGHGVGVAGGRGDHDPDVGRADQLGGQHPVVGHQGVDVGRVQEGDSAGEGVGGLDPQHTHTVLTGEEQLVPRVLMRHPHAREVGQHPHAAEPVMVLRVADEHRCAGRRPQHAGLADPAPDKGVDERRLPRAGGAADHGQQGCFGFFQAGHQIVVELGEQFVAIGTRAWSPARGSGKRAAATRSRRAESASSS